MSGAAFGFGAKWEIWDDTDPNKLKPLNEFFALEADAAQRCKDLNRMETSFHFCIKWHPYTRKQAPEGGHKGATP